MMIDDNDGQMIFGDLVGLKLPDICLTGEEKPQKNLTQGICPDWGSNPGPLHDRCACYHLAHSGGHFSCENCLFGIVVSMSDCHPRGPRFGSSLYPRNFSGNIGSGMGSTQPLEDNWVAT